MSLYRWETITIHVVWRELKAQKNKNAIIRTRWSRLMIVMYDLLLYLFKLNIFVNKQTKRLIRWSFKHKDDHEINEEAVHFLLEIYDYKDLTLWAIR